MDNFCTIYAYLGEPKIAVTGEALFTGVVFKCVSGVEGVAGVPPAPPSNWLGLTAAPAGVTFSAPPKSHVSFYI